MSKLTDEQINRIAYFGNVTIDGDEYMYKDYEYKSEIRKNGELFATVDNETGNVEYTGGRNLKRIRTAAGLSQSQLAERSGVSVRMVQYYEQGYKDINKASVDTAFRLAVALGCKVEDLIEKDRIEKE